MATVSVRYIVNDVDAAIAFYCGHLGFEEVMHPAPTFAMLSEATSASFSAPRAAGRRRPGDARRHAAGHPAAGTASASRSPISRPPSQRSAQPARTSATTSSPASAANRSCSTTPPATRSNSSNQPAPKPPSAANEHRWGFGRAGATPQRDTRTSRVASSRWWF